METSWKHQNAHKSDSAFRLMPLIRSVLTDKTSIYNEQLFRKKQLYQDLAIRKPLATPAALARFN